MAHDKVFGICESKCFVETMSKTELTNALDGKANSSHSHAISDVTNLQSTLNGKASSSHTHDDRYYTESEMNTKLNAKANSSHSHAISDVTNLQSTLNGKMPLTAISNETNYGGSYGSYTYNLPNLNAVGNWGLVNFKGRRTIIKSPTTGTYLIIMIDMNHTDNINSMFFSSNVAITSAPTNSDYWELKFVYIRLT